MHGRPSRHSQLYDIGCNEFRGGREILKFLRKIFIRNGTIIQPHKDTKYFHNHLEIL